MSVKTSNDRELKSGSQQTGDLEKTFSFTEQYQFVGMKGIGSTTSLDSIGLIILDTECDFADPTGSVA